MQTLWSRFATQTRLTCRCPSCAGNAAAHGVYRRPITAAGKRPKYAYSSTLWYSGIFAAAATTDAVVKQRRRDQWDQAIAQVKHDIDGEEEENSRHGRATSHSGQTWEERLVMRLAEAGDASDSDAEQDKYSAEHELHETESIYEDEALAKGGPLWPANTGPPLRQGNLPPQSEYAHEYKKERAAMRLWTPKKLRVTELCVDRMIIRMIIYLHDIDRVEDAAASVPGSFRLLMTMPRGQLEYLYNSTQARLKSLRWYDPYLSLTDLDEEPYEEPVHPHSAQYAQDIDGSHQETGAELLAAIESVFDASRQSTSTSDSTSKSTHDVPATIAKICYNLSVSTAPPTLNVWNSILKNLYNISGDEEPLNAVIQCIRKSKVRANEDTLFYILHTAIKHDNFDSFSQSLAYMRGTDGGMMLARPDINITASGGASRLIRLDEDKIIQKPYPTPKVFQALINGVLQFAGFETALSLCADMGAEGWGLSIRGMVPLLRDCADRNDWMSGTSIWREMCVLQEKSRRSGRAERLPYAAYVDMARLCLEQGEEEMFEVVERQAQADKFRRSRFLKRVVGAMGLEDEVKQGLASAAQANPTSETARKPGSQFQDAEEEGAPNDDSTPVLPSQPWTPHAQTPSSKEKARNQRLSSRKIPRTHLLERIQLLRDIEAAASSVPSHSSSSASASASASPSAPSAQTTEPATSLIEEYDSRERTGTRLINRYV